MCASNSPRRDTLERLARETEPWRTVRITTDRDVVPADPLGNAQGLRTCFLRGKSASHEGCPIPLPALGCLTFSVGEQPRQEPRTKPFKGTLNATDRSDIDTESNDHFATRFRTPNPRRTCRSLAWAAQPRQGHRD